MPSFSKATIQIIEDMFNFFISEVIHAFLNKHKILYSDPVEVSLPDNHLFDKIPNELLESKNSL